MKKVLTILFGFLLFSHLLYANERFSRMRIGLEGSYSYQGGSFTEQLKSSGPGGGLSIGWDFNRMFGLDLIILRGSIFYPKENSIFHYGYSWFGGLNAQLNILPTKKLTPFINLGIGIKNFSRYYKNEQIVTNYNYDPPENKYTYTVVTSGYSCLIGAGMKYFISKWLSIDFSLIFNLNYDFESHVNLYRKDDGNSFGFNTALVFHI